MSASCVDHETILIALLPGVRVLGDAHHPDVLITYQGRAGVTEVG